MTVALVCCVCCVAGLKKINTAYSKIQLQVTAQPPRCLQPRERERCARYVWLRFLYVRGR